MTAALPSDLAAVVRAIRPGHAQVADAARRRQARLTKPAGSLGRLEDLSVQLAAVTGVCPPPEPRRAALAVFAADHGVHAQGVSPWPQEVTAQMVVNFLTGGAAVSVLARQAEVAMLVVDVGVATPYQAPNAPVTRAAQVDSAAPALLARRVCAGTADLSLGSAMTPAQLTAALGVGVEVATDLIEAGHDILLTGDMGIANTTASAALIAAFTGAAPAAVTGRGTGIDDDTHRHKVAVVERALRHHAAAADTGHGPDVLAAVGGLEHAALTGFILAAAARQVPVLLDGVIAGAAALAAQAIAPDSIDYCIAGHRSSEPGHAVALRQLGRQPLIDLDLRLGEGTGAVLAVPLVRAAAALLAQMATFEDAGLSSGPA